MWYKKKDSGSALKSIEITSNLKIWIKECSRPLVFLLDNPKEAIDYDHDSSYKMKIQMELSPDEDNYVSVRAHKNFIKKKDNSDDESDSDDGESNSDDESTSTDNSDHSESTTENEYGSEVSSNEESDSNSSEDSNTFKNNENKKLTNTKSFFNNSFTNIMKSATTTLASLNASKLLGIQYYSFVLVVPGENKDIILRSKRIDQIIPWVNMLAEVTIYIHIIISNI